jgi:hypothetical protein
VDGRDGATAVLCEGPSLFRTYHPVTRGLDPEPDAAYDLVIAVNRAAKWFEADFLVCKDGKRKKDVVPVGSPMLIMGTEDQWRKLKRDNPELAAMPHRCVAGDIDLPKGPVEWVTYSESLAIAWAWQCGARRIDTYGNDWSGKASADGWAGAGRRDEWRWERQARIFDGLSRMLAERGCSVRRIRPDRGPI